MSKKKIQTTSDNQTNVHKKKLMSSWQITLNAKNNASVVSTDRENDGQIIQKSIKVPPTDYINI